MIFSGHKSLKMALAAGALCLAQSANAMPVLSFDFSPSSIDFGAGIIDFDMDFVINDFTIVDQIGGSGALVPLVGEIDGTFTFSAAGNVTSTLGSITIADGLGGTLTGDLDFDILTFSGENEPVQLLNLDGQVDFLSYTGAGAINSDLALLASFGSPYNISTSFTYLGLTTLADLFAFGDGVESPFFALGTIELPEPGALALLGLGILGVGLYGRRRQRHRSDDRQLNTSQHPNQPTVADYGMELTRQDRRTY